jgi:dienelactone hydrolase
VKSTIIISHVLVLFFIIPQQGTSKERGDTTVYTIRQIERKGMEGQLFMPKEHPRKIALILFGGSEGGIYPNVLDMCEALAKEGYPTLALAYFNKGELPKTLANIPLEYFIDAVHYLKDQKELSKKTKVFLMAHSRGGEAALLTASISSEIDGVIAYTPANFACSAPDGQSPAWTWKGKPVTFYKPTKIDFSTSLEAFQYYLKDTVAIAKAEIQSEKVRGPILLLSAGDDRIWPSEKMCLSIISTLKQHHFRYPYYHFNFPLAGHMLFSRTTGPTSYKGDWGSVEFGGTESSQREACGNAWQQVLVFLKSSER